MRNPSNPAPLKTDALVAPREIVEFSAAALHWIGKGSRIVARGIATALDEALRPALVYVALTDPLTHETVVAADGDTNDDADSVATQWADVLAPWLSPGACGRLHLVQHPRHAAKLKLLVAGVGAGAEGGYVAVVSADASFPSERDESLLTVAAHQAALSLAATARAPAPSVQQQLNQLVSEIDEGVEIIDRDWRFVYVNEKAADFLGRSREELVGVSLWELFPDVIGNDTWRRLRDVMERRVSDRLEIYYEPWQRWFDVRARPLDDGIAIVFADISERKRAFAAEREARAEAESLRDLGVALNSELDLSARLQRVTDAATQAVGASFGSFLYRPADGGGEVYAFCGQSRDLFEEFVRSRYATMVGSTDRNDVVFRVDDLGIAARESGESSHGGAGDSAVPARSFLGALVRSRTGAILGGLIFGHVEPARFTDRHARVVVGIAAQAAVAIENAKLFEAVREQADRLRVMHAQVPVGIAEVDFEGRFLAVNDRFGDILGYTRAELLNRHLRDIIHPDDAAIDFDKFAALIAGDISGYQREKRYLRKDGRVIWGRVSTALLRDDQGRPRCVAGILEDITERHQSEERGRFLADVGKRLAGALDYKDTLAQVAHLAVATVADWCAVDIVESRGALSRLAVAHRDPAKLSLARDLHRRYPPDLSAPRGPHHVVRTRTTQFIADVTDEMLESGARDPAHLAALRALRLSSYICTPLVARERVLGALTFVAEAPRRFSDVDREFAEEVARRAAVAIDNARLFEEMREQAARLQATYDRAAVGICEVGLDGRYLGANDRFCAITGYSREELYTRRFHDITHPEDVAGNSTLFTELQLGGRDSYQIDKRYIRKNGTQVWVNVTASLVRDGDGRPKYCIGTVEDITERRRAEIVINGQRKALEQMARGAPLRVVLETLVDTFDRQSMAGATGMVLLLDNEAGLLRPGAVGRLPEEWVEAIREVPVGPTHASCGAAAFRGEPVFVSDIRTDARWDAYRDLALRLGYQAAWSLCLRASTSRILGTFGILYPEPTTPTDEEVRFLELITDTAAMAIERYHDEKSLRLQAEVLSRIHDAVVMLDLAGRVLRWNEGAERLFGYPAGETIGRHVWELGFAPDEYARFAKHALEPVKRTGRFERVMPMRTARGLRHVHMSLSLLNDEQQQPSAIIGYLLDVTERVEAETELNTRMRQQAAVARLGQMALSGVALPELLDGAVRLVSATLEVEVCEVLELPADGAALGLRANVGWGEGETSVSIDPAASQAGFTLGSSEPVVVADRRSEARFRDVVLPENVLSGMTVVIHGARRPYGVLGAHSAQTRRFSDHDVNFLQSVAHVLSNAIERMRFEDAMRQAQEDLERRVEERTAELARANQSLRDEVVERMGVENALRDSEAQYRMLFERNPLAAWVFDINSRNILAANETAVWQYGYTREEFLRMDIDELHPPEEAQRVLDYAGRFPPETAYIGVWKHKKQDDAVIDVEVFVYEVLFQGRWARLMLANDITERRRTEQEFRLMETITRSVSEAQDVDAALYAVLRPICEWTGWVLGEAWLPAASNGRLRCARAWYCGAEGLEEFRRASWERELDGAEALIGRAWTTRQPVWIPDVTAGGTFARAPEAGAAGLRAGIAFPVLAEGEVVVLLGFFLREPRIEDEHQVKLVSTIAAQVGIAIQRKRAEERLRESEERFRLLVEGARDFAIYMLDAEGRVASWNRGAERLKGYASDEILGRHFSIFYGADERARGRAQLVLAQAVADGSHESEGWRLRKDGTRFWAGATITALRDPAGELRGFVKVTRDITERRRTEEQLKESEARLVRAQEFSLLMVAHVALDGRWLKVPPMLCATLAYREEELLARRFEDVTHPDDIGPEWAQCERLIGGAAKSFDLEKRFLRRDGKVIWVYQNTSVVLDSDDRPLHFLTFIRDITQRKEAEEQLRRSQMQLTEAQRLAHLGSWEWDIATGRIEWSEELYRIHGLTPQTPMTFDGYLECVHAEDRGRVRKTIEAALVSGQPFTLEERILRADGETRHLLAQGAVVADPRGEVTRMVGVCLDITERKQAEARLREYTNRLQNLSQRLLEAQETERRRIARELHDQIGQDLSVIKINLQAVQRLAGAASVRPHVDETIRVVEGVLSTARNLSVELRPSMLDDLGLVAALRWYLDRQVQRAGVTLHFEADTVFGRLSPTIETACFRLAQEAVTNILRHADAHHIKVTIARSDVELVLRISDDGRGFDVDAARERAAGGESFGLLGMEERALLAGGKLEIISTRGEGATVVARFPLSATTEVFHEHSN